MAQFKYQQLANSLKEKIDAGVWQVDEKLPAIRVLAEQHQVAKISVQKALYTLEARGLIYVKLKSGYYVAPIKAIAHTSHISKAVSQPKLVNMPDVFFEIMQRSAAFDIAPREIANAQTSKPLLVLNRHISRALRQKAQSKALYYAEPAGDVALREQIAKHYQKRNLQVSAQQICITSGCQNSLFLALSCHCETGDIVAVESPAFYGVLQLLQQLKLKVLEIPSDHHAGISAKSLANAAAKWPIKACVLTANFSTPTGALIPTDEKQALVNIADEHNITLIEDDIYGDLSFHDNVEPLKRFDNRDNVILCSSFSKSLSRDLRIGWVVLNKHYKKLLHLKLIHQLSTSQAIQQGLTSFLSEGHYQRHLYQYRKTLLSQREQLISAIEQHWNFEVNYTIPDGGLVVWLTLPKQVDSFVLYQQAIAQGIILTPGRLFSATDKFSNYFRLSFAHPTTGHRLAAIKALGKLCQQLL